MHVKDMMNTQGPWRLRFAPSPTGFMHLGNARTALLNYFLARRLGGAFLLRVEDTDAERSAFGFEADILSGLAWLGMSPDEPVLRQSQAQDRHQAVARQLLESGHAYPCFCSEHSLEQAREKARQQGQAPRYDGPCASLSKREALDMVDAGQPHTIRFRVPREAQAIAWHDAIKGETSVPAEAFGDFVLLRSGGQPSYTLAVVADDIHTKVTCVLRGEDHLTNTARQILLYQALGQTQPVFAHHGLLLDASHKKLSKRSGALSVSQLRGRGLPALALAHYLGALSGALPPDGVFASLADMAERFDPDKLGRGGVVFLSDDLAAMVRRYWREGPTEALLPLADEAAWHLPGWSRLDAQDKAALFSEIRANCASREDVAVWLGPLLSTEIDYASMAVRELAASPKALFTLLADAVRQALATDDDRLSQDQAKAMIMAAGKELGLKGKSLWHPLRLALLGRDNGPEVAAVLSLLNRSRLTARFTAAADLSKG